MACKIIVVFLPQILSLIRSAVDAGKNVVTSETESEIPKRTVIRTRISGDDPQSAEKEAAALRGAGKAVKKNFKRA